VLLGVLLSIFVPVHGLEAEAFFPFAKFFFFQFIYRAAMSALTAKGHASVKQHFKKWRHSRRSHESL